MALNKLLSRCKMQNSGTVSSPTNYGGSIVVPIVVVITALGEIKEIYPLNSLGPSLSGEEGAPRAL